MTPRVYLYFGVTFLLGILAGGTGMFVYGWYAGHWHPRYHRQRVIQHLRRELDLSDPQVQQLSQILEDSEKKFSELRTRSKPEFDAIREEQRNRISQILNPQQRGKFNEMVRRRLGREKRPRIP